MFNFKENCKLDIKNLLESLSNKFQKEEDTNTALISSIYEGLDNISDIDSYLIREYLKDEISALEAEELNAKKNAVVEDVILSSKTQTTVSKDELSDELKNLQEQNVAVNVSANADGTFTLTYEKSVMGSPVVAAEGDTETADDELVIDETAPSTDDELVIDDDNTEEETSTEEETNTEDNNAEEEPATDEEKNIKLMEEISKRVEDVNRALDDGINTIEDLQKLPDLVKYQINLKEANDALDPKLPSDKFDKKYDELVKVLDDIKNDTDFKISDTESDTESDTVEENEILTEAKKEEDTDDENGEELKDKAEKESTDAPSEDEISDVLDDEPVATEDGDGEFVPKFDGDEVNVGDVVDELDEIKSLIDELFNTDDDEEKEELKEEIDTKVNEVEDMVVQDDGEPLPDDENGEFDDFGFEDDLSALDEPSDDEKETKEDGEDEDEAVEEKRTLSKNKASVVVSDESEDLDENDKVVKETLEEILQSIEDENISYGEIAYLQDHQEEIKKIFPDDKRLWEWAGIPEFEDDDEDEAVEGSKKAICEEELDESEVAEKLDNIENKVDEVVEKLDEVVGGDDLGNEPNEDETDNNDDDIDGEDIEKLFDDGDDNSDNDEENEEKDSKKDKTKSDDEEDKSDDDEDNDDEGEEEPALESKNAASGDNLKTPKVKGALASKYFTKKGDNWVDKNDKEKVYTFKLSEDDAHKLFEDIKSADGFKVTTKGKNGIKIKSTDKELKSDGWGVWNKTKKAVSGLNKWFDPSVNEGSVEIVYPDNLKEKYMKLQKQTKKDK